MSLVERHVEERGKRLDERRGGSAGYTVKTYGLMKITDVAAYDEMGAPISVGDVLILNAGIPLSLSEIARLSGVDKSSLDRWIAAAGSAAQKLERGETPSDEEVTAANWATRFTQALAETRWRLVGTIHDVGVGGYELTTTTMKETQDGFEHSVRREVKDADWKALAWLAERVWHEDWGGRQRLEVTGKDGGPVRIESPREKLMQQLATLRERSIDTTSTDASSA